MSPDSKSQPIRSRLVGIISERRELEETKRLRQDFQNLLDLDAPTRASCIANFGEMRKLRTPRAREQLLQSIEPKTGAGRVRVSSSLDVLNFFVEALLSEETPKDDHNFWADDFESLGWLDKSSHPVFKSLLTELTGESLRTLEVENRRRKTTGGVLPKLRSAFITVESRAVRRQMYRWGDPLDGEDAYRPEILGTTMIASINIDLDVGPPEDVYFQMSESDVDNLISSLMAAKRDMDSLARYLNLDSEGIVKKSV